MLRSLSRMDIDPTPIRAEGPLDFYVEVWNDDNSHYIRITSHGHFDATVAAFDGLVAGKPAMRLVMRKRAHVDRNYIPARLHNRYDREKEYPTR